MITTLLALLLQVNLAQGKTATASSEEAGKGNLAAKAVDLIVFNDVSRADIGFDADANEVVIVSDAGEREVERRPKREIAAAVLDEVERLLSQT